MFIMMGVESSLRNGSFSSTNDVKPTFSRPMELSMPHGVSTILGGGLPMEGLSDKPLTIIAPSRFRSIRFSNSLAYPNVPDAVITGFFSSIPPILTDRSALLFIILVYYLRYAIIAKRSLLPLLQKR